MRDLLDQFERENPGITVSLEATPYNAYFEKLTTSFAAANPPDVFWIDIHTAQFAKQGVLLPLDEYLTPESRADLIGRGLQEGSWNGVAYGIPMHEIVEVIYYNTAMFEELGIEAPTSLDEAWTWDEFLSAAKMLTRDLTGNGETDIWGFYQERRMDIWALVPYVVGAGGSFLSPDGCTAQGYSNSPNTVAGVAWWGKLVSEHRVMPYDLIPEPLPTGKVAMLQAPSPRYEALRKNYPDFEFGVMPMPRGPQGGAVTTGGWSVAIAKSTRDPEAAWKLTDFLTNTGNRQWVEQSGYLPVRRSVLEQLEQYNEYPYKLFIDELMQIPAGRPPTPAYGALWDAWASALRNVAAGADAQAELNQLAQRTARDLQRACR